MRVTVQNHATAHRRKGDVQPWPDAPSRAQATNDCTSEQLASVGAQEIIPVYLVCHSIGFRIHALVLATHHLVKLVIIFLLQGLQIMPVHTSSHRYA